MTKEAQEYEKAIVTIVTTAKLAAPDEPRKAIELMLLSALSYCRNELGISPKESCDALDMCLFSIYEEIDE